RAGVRGRDAGGCGAARRARPGEQGTVASAERVGAGRPSRGDGPRWARRRAARALAEALGRMIRAAAMRARGGLGMGLGLVMVSWVVAARAEVANRIVATIDGEPITAHELKVYAKDRDPGGAEGKQILDALITDKLLEREIKALGIVARDDEIDR